MTINSRLLPPGFAWGMAVAVAAAVISLPAFGFTAGLLFICGFILSACLAAVYSHAKESAPPDFDALRRERMKKKHWPMVFWGVGVAMCLMMMLGGPPAAADGLTAGFCAGGIWTGWWIVRLPFLSFLNNAEKVKENFRLLEVAIVLIIPMLVVAAAAFWHYAEASDRLDGLSDKLSGKQGGGIFLILAYVRVYLFLLMGIFAPLAAARVCHLIYKLRRKGKA